MLIMKRSIICTIRNSLFLSILLIWNEGCIDRLNIVTQSGDHGTLVADGFISDQPGPYIIRLFRTTTSENVLEASIPVTARQVIISDDIGNSEVLSLDQDGRYVTSENGIRGQPGRSYSIRIELLNGSIFESTPETLLPTGEIDTVYSQWESFQPLDGPSRYGFRIYTSGSFGEAGYTRLRFQGVYMAQSYPELNKWQPNCSIPEPPPHIPNPLPCSGYITTGIVTRFGVTLGDLIQVGDCTCCFCWVIDAENKPKLSNDVISTKGSYKNIEVGYVPFNEWTFANNRYMYTVEQMSLTEGAFNFWKIIADQKEGATSLFQPAFGKATTNIFSNNSDEEIIGYFYATSVSKKVVFLTSGDAPIPVPKPGIEPKENCALWCECTNIFPYSVGTKPKDWMD